MHKDDQMTPKERSTALKDGKAVDRMPIGMIYGVCAANLLGWSRRDGDSSARQRADCVKKAYEVFGTDGIGTGYGLHGAAAAFGAKMSNSEYAAPHVLEHPVKNIDDIPSLDLSILSVEKDPWARMCMETVQILVDELGDEVDCGFCLPGAFTSLSSMVGTQDLLRALAHKPNAVHKAMEFVTDGLLQLAREFLEIEVPINIADPVASGSVISKKQFDTFVAPYAKRFANECNAIRPFGVSCHICGNTTKILENIAACGFCNVDIDNAVDLNEAKERIGETVHISGNVDPTGVLFLGTPAQVKETVRARFREAWDSPKGFTINTGCDSAWGTPIENSLAYMEASRKCAKYPLNPDNFI